MKHKQFFGIKRYPNHLLLWLGKTWVSFDKTGVMGWIGSRNFYYLFKERKFKLTKKNI